MRPTWSPGKKASPQRSPKGAARPPPQADGSAGPRHAAEEGQATHPRPDPARWPSGSTHAGQLQQTTIQPIIEAAVAKGARIHTDEYDIYVRLPAWGYRHKTVCHA